EIEGQPGGVAETAQTVAQLLGGISQHVQWSDRPAEVAALWQARSVRGAASALIKEHATRVATGEDTAVPTPLMPDSPDTTADRPREPGSPRTTGARIGSANAH